MCESRVNFQTPARRIWRQHRNATPEPRLCCYSSAMRRSCRGALWLILLALAPPVCGDTSVGSNFNTGTAGTFPDGEAGKGGSAQIAAVQPIGPAEGTRFGHVLRRVASGGPALPPSPMTLPKHPRVVAVEEEEEDDDDDEEQEDGDEEKAEQSRQIKTSARSRPTPALSQASEELRPHGVRLGAMAPPLHLVFFLADDLGYHDLPTTSPAEANSFSSLGVWNRTRPKRTPRRSAHHRVRASLRGGT